MDKKPIIYDPKTETLESFKQSRHISEIVDQYREMVYELYSVRFPESRLDPEIKTKQQQFYSEHLENALSELAGVWFYFPWNQKLVHYLKEDLHQELRTARNKNIVTKAEQEKLYDSTIGIAGLSVGSHAALTLALSGIGKRMKLADPDNISGSNLNRVRKGFGTVGKNKALLTAQDIYEINPYMEIEIFEEGVNIENINRFFNDPTKLDLLVEEVDDLRLKILLREQAKKENAPVVMATDNGDNVIVDIERYDLNSGTKLFNGLAGDINYHDFKNLSQRELPKLSTLIAGKDLVVPKMQDSLLEVGKTLYSWPQLGLAATLSGVAVAYVAKKILLNERIRDGKLEINLDSIFDPEYNFPDKIKYRQQKIQNFHKQIGMVDDLFGLLQEIIHNSVNAPSGDNTQPWRFELGKNFINLYNFPDRDNPVLNYEQSGSYIAHGCLLENLRLNCLYGGYEPEIKLFPDIKQPNLVATVSLKEKTETRDELQSYIKDRHTNRRPYNNQPLTEKQKTEIKNCVLELGLEDGYQVKIVADEKEVYQLAKTAASVEEVILENKTTHRLFFDDIVWTKRKESKVKSGLYLATMEFAVPQKVFFWLASHWPIMKLMNRFGLSRFIAREDTKLYAKSSAICGVVIPRTTPESYINAGRILQRVWLKTVKLGLALHPVSALPFAARRAQGSGSEVFNSLHREKITKNYGEQLSLFKITTEFVGMVFRVGFAQPPSAVCSKKEAQIKIISEK
ncbi:MAG: hypothetical protein COT91_01185 [Candidatus Doudnabacteria bacterium CG10_big_fil_rev_8_21_14_0_10_41_10]|uniref:THIF-type NAD/FAD binding fold domain-containing protein n=1 Tax=Candidatus Doudnabacteria bacterium CG10_big_fil_rev_8_21_14_0_10_41_10 TaxID=1974551 RepID=A0A2H0VEG4_9BACT|nr:MAG: hypothetical protein COT91_01185 [Candidatus Doudnabacteria bacterium CG10_big_fil_rev_8_21_14_0_10_41_10]